MSDKITSLSNPKVKTWLKLLSGRGIKKEGRFLLSGRKTVPEYIASLEQASSTELLYSKTNPYEKSFKGPAWEVTPEVFQELDIFGTDHPLLVAPLPDIPRANLEEEPQGLEVLCPLGDPRNLGALVRTCVAMKVSRIILLSESSHPFHPHATRASAGLVLKAPFAVGPSLEQAMNHIPKESSFCLQAKGQNIYDVKWPKNVRLIIGEEGLGLPQGSKIKSLKIPMSDNVESLNAVVAASMAMFSYRQQYKTKL